VLDLTGLIHLQQLDLERCKMLTDVQGIDTLATLHSLSLDRCGQLSRALDLTKLTSLTDLSLDSCVGLTAVTAISKLAALTTLNLEYCNSLSFADEPVGTTMPALRTLRVTMPSIMSYFQRQSLPALNALIIVGCSGILTLDCSSWPSLTTLTVQYCNTLTALQGLDKLSLLKELNVFGCSQLQVEHTCLKSMKSNPPLKYQQEWHW
jgi:internalin A